MTDEIVTTEETEAAPETVDPQVAEALGMIDGHITELRSEIVTVKETAYKEYFATYCGLGVVLAALGIIAGLQAVRFFKGD